MSFSTSSLSTSAQQSLALDELRVLAARKFVPRLDWQLRYRSMLKPGLRFDLDGHRYLKGIYADDGTEVIYRKSAQCGVSEFLLTDALWVCDQRKGNVLYVLPTDKVMGNFSQARLDPAIEASEYLQRIVISERTKAVRGVDNVGLKRIGSRFMYLRGAQIAPGGSGKAHNLKSIDADCVILDELDEMDASVPELAYKRLGHSALKFMRMASTPTFSGVGIEAQWAESSQHTWHVRCTHCGNRQPLEIGDLVTDFDELGRPAMWHGKGDGVAPYMACRNCLKPLDRLSAGEWVAAYPSRPKHGYHVSKLFSAQNSLEGVIANLSKPDESDQQQAYNQDLGLPYKSKNGQALTAETLDKCRREYALGPKGGGAFMGIDVGRVLNIVIRGRDYGLRYAGQPRDFDQARELALEHGVTAIVSDALPETRLARQFQISFPQGMVWLCYYSANGTKDVKGFEFNLEDMIILADRTRTMDATMALFRMAARGEPGATLPATARDIPDYYKQMCAPERVERKGADGKITYHYVERGADHFAHAENYCHLAAQWWLFYQDHKSEHVYNPVRIGDY